MRAEGAPGVAVHFSLRCGSPQREESTPRAEWIPRSVWRRVGGGKAANRAWTGWKWPDPICCI